MEQIPADQTPSTESGEELKLDAKSSSALRENIKTKGHYSYYYAHAKKPGEELDPNAKILEGEGIVTGGPPKLISIQEGSSADNKKVEQKQPKRITKYAWHDDGAKGVKLYIEFGENKIEGKIVEEMVDFILKETELKVKIVDENGDESVLHFPKLFDKVNVHSSHYKIRGSKVVVTLLKANDSIWKEIKKNEDSKAMDKD